MLLMEGAGVRYLFRELDPTCCNQKTCMLKKKKKNKNKNLYVPKKMEDSACYTEDLVQLNKSVNQ